MKLIGRYYLLCDACNWEFTGFAMPGTVSSKPTRRKSRQDSINTNDNKQGITADPEVPVFDNSGKKDQKKVKSSTRS